MSFRTAVAGLAALVVLVGAVFIGALAKRPASSPLASVDDLRRKGLILLQEQRAYLVWNGGKPLALSTDAQHIGDHVVFCPTSQMFESPMHGEKFDLRGFYYGGSASRGLDRYALQIQGRAIYVDFSEIIPGPPRGAGPPRPPRGAFCH